MFKGLASFIDKCSVKFDGLHRVFMAIVGAGIFLIILLSTFFGKMLPQASESEAPKDTNVYLGEEVCYAKDIYIKVVGINVIENDDPDSECRYYLNLTLDIEQRAEEKPSGTKIGPKNFELRAINQKAKGKLRIFFETLAQSTFETMLSIPFEGEVNVIEETLNLALDYSATVVDDVQTNKKLDPIKLDQLSFDSFYPKDETSVRRLTMVFPITDEYLETDYTLVLSIDAVNHRERRIFLTVRPIAQEAEEK